MLTPTAEEIITILERITDSERGRLDHDSALFDLGVLDSFTLVELLLALEDQFGIDIRPAEIEREQWASPQSIAACLERRQLA